MSENHKRITTIDPIMKASLTIAVLRHRESDNDNAEELKEALQEQIANIQSGDFSQLESLLYTQAIALNEVFNKFISYSALTDHQGCNGDIKSNCASSTKAMSCNVTGTC